MLVAARHRCRTFRASRLNQTRPWSWHRLQTLALQLAAYQRNLASSRVHTTVGDLPQPGFDSCVGGVAIDLESFGTELARQRNVEARANVTDEAFDLALGLGPIRPAQPRQEAVMMREV